MTSRVRFVRLLLTALLIITAALQGTAATPARVVAIGDIHGALDGLVTILARAGLIDANRRWSGGATTLVQTGDYTDRGEGVRAVMDLLIALEGQAPKGGGQAIVLLGNHEIMNLIRETRDVTPGIFATFADRSSENRREEAWRQYQQLAKIQQTSGAPLAPVYAQPRAAWMAAHPLGYIEYREAFAPRGTYGRWLRGKAPAARVADTAFMHAGLDPITSEFSLEDVNAKVKKEIARFDAYVGTLVDRKLALPFFSLQEVGAVTVNELRMAGEKQASKKSGREAPSPTLDGRWLAEAVAVADITKWAILAPEGPLWFRGYATWPGTNAPLITTILQRFRADRIVVAHTPQPNAAIVSRFNNRLFLIDTGMLASVYNGQPSALEIEGTRIKALYPEKEVVLVGQ